MEITKYLALASVAIPVVCILLSILLSEWFNLFENALSDLGHATRSRVAPLFNIGLVTGGLLTYSVAILSRNTPWIYNAILMYTGFSLILVGVFDEVYGKLHFVVSVMFFLGLLAFFIYTVIAGSSIPLRVYSLIASILGIIVWIIHFKYRIPRGAAIPELISIVLYIPVYFYVYLH